MKKICFLLSFVILLSVCTVSCNIGQIEDINGADTALATLTEEEILRNGTTYTNYGSVTSEKDGVLSFRVKKLSGVYRVVQFNISKESNVQLNLSLTLTSGNLRAVLLCDGVLVQDIPQGSNQVIEIPNAKGSYEIRLAGESAALEFTCSKTTLK